MNLNIIGRFAARRHQSNRWLWRQVQGGFSTISALASRSDKTVPMKCHLLKRTQSSPDTFVFRYSLPTGADSTLGIAVVIRAHLPTPERPEGENVVRKYTPVSRADVKGYFDLLIKVYYKNIHPKFPDGGVFSQYLEKLKIGDAIDVNGPTGKLNYLGKGRVSIKADPPLKRKPPGHRAEKLEGTFKNIAFISGGTGITPSFQVMQHILDDQNDPTRLFLIFGNRSEDDILLKNELDAYAKSGRLSLTYTLDKAGSNWRGKTGVITEAMIKESFPAAGPDTLITACGPPGMTNAAMTICKTLGYDTNLFFRF